jgi:hypothetical protein
VRQSRISPSSPAEATISPSAESAVANTHPVCPRIHRTKSAAVQLPQTDSAILAAGYDETFVARDADHRADVPVCPIGRSRLLVGVCPQDMEAVFVVGYEFPQRLHRLRRGLLAQQRDLQG